MPASRQFETVDFDAPIGTRVRIMTALVGAILIVIGLIPFFLRAMGGPKPPPTVVAWLGPLIALPLVVVILLLAIIRGYRLAGDELQIVRLGRVNRYALDRLVSIETDRQALEHAWKLWGNDGLGAITGLFRSKRLGKFEVLLTDSAHAVVLRWPDRTLVVSPEREDYFVESVRTRANLRR